MRDDPPRSDRRQDHQHDSESTTKDDRESSADIRSDNAGRRDTTHCAEESTSDHQYTDDTKPSRVNHSTPNKEDDAAAATAFDARVAWIRGASGEVGASTAALPVPPSVITPLAASRQVAHPLTNDNAYRA